MRSTAHTSSLTRRSIRARAADPAAWSLEAIDAQVARCDGDEAAARCLARVMNGQPLPIATAIAAQTHCADRWVAAAIIGLAEGDRADAALAAIVQRAYAEDVIGEAMEVLALFAAWKYGAAKDAIVREARRIVRRCDDEHDCELLAWLIRKLGDPYLAAIGKELAAFLAPDTDAFVAELSSMFDARPEDILKELPEEETGQTSGFTVRAQPKVGRNDLCPCGSGKKYKKCHADQDAAAAPSPIVGMGWDDYLRTGAAQMTIDDINKLHLRDLPLVDRTALTDVALVGLFRRYVGAHRWQLAAEAVEEMAARPSFENVDDLRYELVVGAFEGRVIDVAAAELAKMTTPSADHEVCLAIARRDPDALDRLLDRARQIVVAGGHTEDLDFAYRLRDVAPALGILLLRGCLRYDRPLDNETAILGIQDARDELNILPVDPAQTLYDQLVQEEADEKGAVDAAGEEKRGLQRQIGGLRSALLRASEREKKHEATIADLKKQLAAATRPAPATGPANDADRVRELRSKVAELESTIRAGIEERRELRDRLAAQAPARATAAPAPEPERDDAELEGEAPPDARRGVAIPELARRAIDAIHDAPAAVAAEALRSIGAIAAGDRTAWRGVKQAKDMPRQLLMARIGIHHRLLFRVEDQVMSVLELVTREELDTRLKLIRTNRT